MMNWKIKCRLPLVLMMIVLTGLQAAAAQENEADAAAADAVAEYRLGAGDRVRVVVFGHDDLSGEFEVDGAGRVSLPLIQMVEAAGRTTVELEDAVTDRLRPDYLKNPRVSVEVVSFRPVYILGEVRQPGSYAYSNGMTVVNAVALAGGYTYRASKRKITVTRASDPNKNKQSVGEDTPIFPGDVVEVPERFF